MAILSNKLRNRKAGPKPVKPNSMRNKGTALLQRLDRGGMAIYHFPKQRLSKRRRDIRKGKRSSVEHPAPRSKPNSRTTTDNAGGSVSHTTLTTFIEDTVTPHPLLGDDVPNAALLTYLMPANVALHAGPNSLATWTRCQGNDLAAREIARSDSSDAQPADVESFDETWAPRANAGRSCCATEKAPMPAANIPTIREIDAAVAVESDDEVELGTRAVYNSRIGVEAWLGMRAPLEVEYTMGEHIEEVEASSVARQRQCSTEISVNDGCKRRESLREKIRRWSWPLRSKSRRAETS